MAIEEAKKYLAEKGYEDRVMELDHSSATVAEAAEALGCEEKQIAKTLSFLVKDTPILIVAAGDAKVDNKKYKGYFGVKAKMIPGTRGRGDHRACAGRSLSVCHQAGGGSLSG